MTVYAIVPARSLSKGLPNKNIREIGGKPLIAYSIAFANRLQSVDRVICSTDSCEYAEIAKRCGAEVPFLRSKLAAADHSMEEDILRDLRLKFEEVSIDEPDIVVWLRPTFVFRSIKDVEKCIETLKTKPTYTAARTVIHAENRLYRIQNDILVPDFDDHGKSMIRRQDMCKAFKVFNTDVFRFKGNEFSDDFLGRSVFAVESEKICGFDIDDEFDFEIVKYMVEHLEEFVHEYL